MSAMLNRWHHSRVDGWTPVLPSSVVAELETCVTFIHVWIFSYEVVPEQNKYKKEHHLNKFDPISLWRNPGVHLHLHNSFKKQDKMISAQLLLLLVVGVNATPLVSCCAFLPTPQTKVRSFNPAEIRLSKSGSYSHVNVPKHHQWSIHESLFLPLTQSFLPSFSLVVTKVPCAT